MMSNGDCCASPPIAPAGDDMVAQLESPAGAQAELAAALACDVDSAFERFVIVYRECVVAFVARMLGDDARAEDVAQDAFVRAYHALRSYPPERRAALKLRSWLYAIAHNLTRNAVRDAPRRTESLEFADGAQRAVATLAPQAGPDEIAASNERWSAVAAAIELLSPKLRPAYVMRYLDDLSYEEIALALHQPIGTVKASAHRAALAVRSHLEKFDG